VRIKENEGLHCGTKKKILPVNAFIGLDGYSGSRGIEGKGGGGERAENEATKRGGGIGAKSKCIVGTTAGDEKSILSLEMPATNCPARDKILAVVRNSARESPFPTRT